MSEPDDNPDPHGTYWVSEDDGSVCRDGLWGVSSLDECEVVRLLNKIEIERDVAQAALAIARQEHAWANAERDAEIERLNPIVKWAQQYATDRSSGFDALASDAWDELQRHVAALAGGKGGVVEKLFPIMHGGSDRSAQQRVTSIPWSTIEPHEAQALANHGQSLKTLALRGGLTANEAFAVVSGKGWHVIEILRLPAAEDRLLSTINCSEGK